MGDSPLDRLRALVSSRPQGASTTAPAEGTPTAPLTQAPPLSEQRQQALAGLRALVRGRRKETDEDAAPGPATLAHGNEAPPSRLGPISFDPVKLSAASVANHRGGVVAPKRAPATSPSSRSTASGALAALRRLGERTSAIGGSISRTVVSEGAGAPSASPTPQPSSSPQTQSLQPASPPPASALPVPASADTCPLCRGTGAIQQGSIAVFCSCPIGKAKHDRDLALAWGPEEVRYVAALLRRRAKAAEVSAARAALVDAAQQIERANYHGDNAVVFLRQQAARTQGETRAALESAAEAVEGGAHLPPPPPAEVAEANAIARYLEARAENLSSGADRGALTGAALTIRRLSFERVRAKAHLERLARRTRGTSVMALLNAASDIATGMFAFPAGPAPRAPSAPTAPPVEAEASREPSTATKTSVNTEPAATAAPPLTPASAASPAALGIRLFEDEGRVKVAFAAKPTRGSREWDVKEALKRTGFSWWEPGKAWTKRVSDDARRLARDAVALAGSAPQPAPEAAPPTAPPEPSTEEPLVAGPVRTEYALPDGGRLELGRSMSFRGPTVALHFPRTGRLRSLDLVEHTDVSAPMVQRHPSPTEDELALFAALAADMGSAQARADLDALVAARPAPPPVLSDRIVDAGHWELRHDRNDRLITLSRKPLSGGISTPEQSELTALGMDVVSPKTARARYSGELWARLTAWLDARGVAAFSRLDAATRIAAKAKERGLSAEVVAPLGIHGPVRVAITREGADPKKAKRYDGGSLGWVWVLMDGRLRVEAAFAKDEDAVRAELETMAQEALGGTPVVPVARDPNVRRVRELELLQDEAGSWLVRKNGRDRGETFVTRSDAEYYLNRVVAQHEARPLGREALVALQLPERAGSDEGSAALRFDLDAARIDRWIEGAPVVTLPYELRDANGTRRGELSAWEEVGRQTLPGHRRYARVHLDEQGERYGAQVWTDTVAPAWVRDTMRELLSRMPPVDVSFDGARVTPLAPTDGIAVSIDDPPSAETLRRIRRGKFKRASAKALEWRSTEPDAWWWARHVAYGVQQERAAARDGERVPASAAAPISHRVADARDRLRMVRAALVSSEQHAHSQTRALLRKGVAERIQREVDGLLQQRDDLQEMVRLYREDGSRRPLHEPAPALRDFRAPLPERPTRVARGIELWEHAGHLRVRLAAEPGQWLARILHLSGMSRSRRRGEDRIWSQPSSPLGRYWAHWLAEHEREKDANRPDLVAERFAAGEVPPDEAPTTEVPAETTAAPRSATMTPPVVTVSMRLAERIIVLATPGRDVRAWEDAAREQLADATETERDETVRVVRDRILTIANGAIVEDEWLRAFTRAWGSARRTLIAARLFADQPIVVAAAEIARERGTSAVIPGEELEALLPAGLPAADRQRARRALGDALHALGLAERETHGGELRATQPTAASAPWGWLLAHDLRRNRRVEAPEEWALHDSLAARLLGYSEGAARWAMDAAYAEGWFTRSVLAGTPHVLLRSAEAAPASVSQPLAGAQPAASPEPVSLAAVREARQAPLDPIAREGREHVPVPDDVEARRAAFADKRERRIEGLRAAGVKRLNHGETLYRHTGKLLDMIPGGQPNIVDTVSGRRAMRRREKLHAQRRRSWELLEDGRSLVARADAAEANKAIFSDDPDAIEKLHTVIAEREEAQAYMKRVNAAVRAADRAKLKDLGLDDAAIAKLFTPDFAGRVGFPAYALTNNLNQIQRLRERVMLLEDQRREGPKAAEKYGGVEVREEDNRVRILFPDKPSAQDRASLKRAGFKWSPTAGAWQRHASSAAWDKAREIARKLGGPRASEESTRDPADRR
jgi:hypothetical protein